MKISKKVIQEIVRKVLKENFFTTENGQEISVSSRAGGIVLSVYDGDRSSDILLTSQEAKQLAATLSSL